MGGVSGKATVKRNRAMLSKVNTPNRTDCLFTHSAPRQFDCSIAKIGILECKVSI